MLMIVMIGCVGAASVSAQKAKDLYTQYDSSGGGNGGSSGGVEGAKVCVLLKRGSRPEKIVSANETFYSGDKIKLIFDINFSGYAAILNIGPTGNQSLLFPYLDNAGQLVNHHISPNAGTQLPRGNDWIIFDRKTGDEQISVIFSKKPIVELGKYEEAVTNGSDGHVASETESDQILAELNSKSLSGGRSKDLFTQTEGENTYAVAQNGLGNEPVAFTFYLKHR
jgi:hypothetical protein